MYIMFRLMALIMMLLSVQTTAVAAEDGAEASGSEKVAEVVALPPVYPNWPEHVAYVEAVPAPPLGPYMSTGLQREARGFACCESKGGRGGEAVSLENTPWPKLRSPPQQWEPENGKYSYAPGEDAIVGGSKQQAGYASRPWPQHMRPPVYQWHPQGGYR